MVRIAYILTPIEFGGAEKSQLYILKKCKQGTL